MGQADRLSLKCKDAPHRRYSPVCHAVDQGLQSRAVILFLFHLIYSFRLKASSVDGNADNEKSLIESMNVRFSDRQSLCFYIREG